MNNLIAAARVKQRQVAQAQFQPLSTYYTQGGTPRPSTIQPFLSASSNIDQADWQGVLQHQTLASPSTNGYQSISQNEIDDIEKENDTRTTKFDNIWTQPTCQRLSDPRFGWKKLLQSENF
ncbi:hypothetical protein LR48_Vigan05g004800 [Vigna angularis]|uniref:Uncharacterized protein n=1 Tax=Phaseolus angularis TaxID=3914 RepID=A0A0L9UIS5_PHAAN|nr:hypothetical protein LR48_Vigan05g004800 [Vigna angularis]